MVVINNCDYYYYLKVISTIRYEMWMTDLHKPIFHNFSLLI
jgi:hypothetical protein